MSEKVPAGIDSHISDEILAWAGYEDVLYFFAMSLFSVVPLDGIAAHLRPPGPPPPRPRAYAKQWVAIVAFVILVVLQTIKGYALGQIMCLLNLALRILEI